SGPARSRPTKLGLGVLSKFPTHTPITYTPATPTAHASRAPLEVPVFQATPWPENPRGAGFVSSIWRVRKALSGENNLTFLAAGRRAVSRSGTAAPPETKAE